MIEFPTVFILGAGSSIPFGFPSGRRLVADICRNLEDQHSEFKLKLKKCDFDEDLIERFRKELHFSMQPSIDLFLEKRPEYLEIGKAAIATALIPCENPSCLGVVCFLGFGFHY